MAHVVIMPRQGNTVESCIIVGWKKKEGDIVEADTPICEVETDKATFEVTAGVAGTILKILHGESDDVPVLQPIAVIGSAGEQWQSVLSGEASSGASNEKTQTEAAETGASHVTQAEITTAAVREPLVSGTFSISPRARNKAYTEAVDVSHIKGSGPAGRIIEADIKAQLSLHEPLTPAAKEQLRLNGLQGGVPSVGSGIGGRVTLEDIAKMAQTAPSNEVSAVLPQANASVLGDEYTDTPIKGIRKVIAEKMISSLAATAQFTLNASTPAVRLQELRKRFKESKPELGLNKITINDLLLFAASRMLPLYPYMNAHKLGGTLRTFKAVHLGMAVDTPRGLMVPVIRNAHLMTLAQISQAAKELANACINGNIKPEQLSGSTLTVTNLGNTGIDSFTPVINTPEVAILGICGIQPKLAEKEDGEYDVLPHISFSLTIDHSVVDGSPAAKFLSAFCDAVKNIDILLAQ